MAKKQLYRNAEDLLGIKIKTLEDEIKLDLIIEKFPLFTLDELESRLKKPDPKSAIKY